MGILQKVLVGIGAVAIVVGSAALSYTIMSVVVGRTPAATPQPPAPIGQTKLHIKEWSIALPLTDTIRDAKYYFSPTTGADIIIVTTKHATDLVSKVEGCRSGLYGTAIHRIAAGEKVTENKVYLVTKAYRFESAKLAEISCMPPNVPQELHDILAGVDTAVEKMHEE